VNRAQERARAVQAAMEHWSSNPVIVGPGSRPQDVLPRLVEQYRRGDAAEVCVLTLNETDTGWFHALFAAASAVCFVKGRLAFGEYAPMRGSVVFYLGPRGVEFAKEFQGFGGTILAGGGPDDG
jgi:hypothetical protein